MCCVRRVFSTCLAHCASSVYVVSGYVVSISAYNYYYSKWQLGAASVLARKPATAQLLCNEERHVTVPRRRYPTSCIRPYPVHISASSSLAVIPAAPRASLPRSPIFIKHKISVHLAQLERMIFAARLPCRTIGPLFACLLV